MQLIQLHDMTAL